MLRLHVVTESSVPPTSPLPCTAGRKTGMKLAIALLLPHGREITALYLRGKGFPRRSPSTVATLLVPLCEDRREEERCHHCCPRRRTEEATTMAEPVADHHWHVGKVREIGTRMSPVVVVRAAAIGSLPTSFAKLRDGRLLAVNLHGCCSKHAGRGSLLLVPAGGFIVRER
nr:hypothetical protein Iba_chr04eCG19920 [Ipomoea batatas]